MQLQSIPRSFTIRCYACKREVEMTTQIWEIDPENDLVEYWGACPYCGAELFECAGRQTAEKKSFAGVCR